MVTSCESCQTRRPKPVVNCFDVAPHTITKLLSFLATKLSLSLEALKVWNKIQLNLPTHMKTMFLNLNLNSLSQRCEPTIIANTLRNWFAAFVKKEETTCWLMKLSLLPASCYLCFLSKTKVKLKFFFGNGFWLRVKVYASANFILFKNDLKQKWVNRKCQRHEIFALRWSWFVLFVPFFRVFVKARLMCLYATQTRTSSLLCWGFRWNILSLLFENNRESWKIDDRKKHFRRVHRVRIHNVIMIVLK